MRNHAARIAHDSTDDREQRREVDASGGGDDAPRGADEAEDDGGFEVNLISVDQTGDAAAPAAATREPTSRTTSVSAWVSSTTSRIRSR